VRLPSWFEDGARVVVKSTAIARRHGVRTFGGFDPANNRAWPGEVGTVHEDRTEIWFSGGRTLRVTPENLEAVRRQT
jgi:hypothetical protein